ncbi:MAG: SUMF1/EgtB/PvdO family nonheme iron enzyme, partial [Pseudomonadota bacterium]
MLAGCSGDEQISAALGDCQPLADLGGPVAIKAGQYRLGDSRFYPEEGPVVSVEVGAFDIDAHEVTNAQFAAFVEATGYITRAERGLPEADFDHLPD